MIKSITVTNHLGESIKMELRNPEKSGFLILSIDGLGPSKANINMTELSTGDGSLFNSSRVTERNIIIIMKLLENPTIEDSRQKTYKYFPVKKRIKLVIETDNRLCETYGIVESNAPAIFSSMETTQISIICPDPYFYSSGKDGTNVTVFAGIESQFEFPFSNESLEENLISFGEIINNQEQTIYYTGESDVGIVIYIHALGEARNLTIYNLLTREKMKINTDLLESLTGYPIIAGDDIIISTVVGDKYARLLREGLYINILNCIERDADWFQLSKGDNMFAFVAETGADNLQFRIENKILYEGV